MGNTRVKSFEIDFHESEPRRMVDLEKFINSAEVRLLNAELNPTNEGWRLVVVLHYTQCKSEKGKMNARLFVGDYDANSHLALSRVGEMYVRSCVHSSRIFYLLIYSDLSGE